MQVQKLDEGWKQEWDEALPPLQCRNAKVMLRILDMFAVPIPFEFHVGFQQGSHSAGWSSRP